MQTLLLIRGPVRAYSLPDAPRAWSRKAYDRASRKRWASVGFSSAAGVAATAPFIPTSGGGGPSTAPSWIAAGTAGDTGTAPAYGTNLAGDLFAMFSAGRLTAHNTPAGWTARGSTFGASGRGVWCATRDARSTGGESGTVAITATGNSYTTTIHTFRNVATSSFVEDESTGGRESNGVGPEPPSITAGGNHRLAVFVSGDGNQALYADDISGETGGTWVLRAQAGTGTGNNSAYALYTATLAGGGTISGGSGAVGLDEHITRGFALVGV
jgi:hypothetical protein